MTEGDAKTKWCPFANVYVQYQATGAVGNRGLSDTPNTQGNKAQAMCLGSACMAWRETASPCHRCGGDGFVAHAGMCQEDRCPMWAESNNPAALKKDHGYCGLAGKP